MKLTFEDWAGLAVYAFALLACIRGLVRYTRNPRQARRPGLGLASGAGIVASEAAIIVLLLDDTTSGVGLSLQRWLFWPAVIAFAGSLAVMIGVYRRNRARSENPD